LSAPVPEYARLTTSALSAQTRDVTLVNKINSTQSSRVGLTVAEEVEEVGVVFDRLLDAEDTNLAELVVEDPLAECRLNDVGSVEAASPGVSIEL
jgi:hypothetical protein